MSQTSRRKNDMTKIFISYRRTDSQDVTGRIYDRLVAHFSQERVFKDVESIPAEELLDWLENPN
jgi:hypothetical protein